MEALAAAMIAVAMTASVASTTDEAKRAVVAYYSANGNSVEVDEKKRVVEICSDLCEYYEIRGGVTDSAWDVIFLHQYYFVAPEYRETFREQHSSLAADLLKRNGYLCPGVVPDKLPPCILNKLGLRNQVQVAFVRYDEGYRCQVWGRLTNPKYQGRNSCRKVKHAS